MNSDMPSNEDAPHSSKHWNSRVLFLLALLCISIVGTTIIFLLRNNNPLQSNLNSVSQLIPTPSETRKIYSTYSGSMYGLLFLPDSWTSKAKILYQGYAGMDDVYEQFPKTERIDSFNLLWKSPVPASSYCEQNNPKTLCMNPPIEVVLDLNKLENASDQATLRKTIKDCEWNMNTAAFYQKTNDNTLTKLPLRFNAARKWIIGTISNAYLNGSSYNVHLEVHVQPSKYLWQCGSETKAYLDGNKMIVNSLGFYLNLINNERPFVDWHIMFGTVFKLPDKFAPYESSYILNVYDDFKSLPTNRLDEIEWGYEGIPVHRLLDVPGMTILSKNVVKINNQNEALILEASDKDIKAAIPKPKKELFVLIRNPYADKNNDAVVYMFTLSALNTVDSQTWNELETMAINHIKTISIYPMK